MDTNNLSKKAIPHKKPIARFIAGIITCFIAFCLLYSRYDDNEDFFKHAHKFEATVTDVTRIKRNSKSRTRYRLTVEYFSTTAEVYVKHRKSVGDSINVYVNYFYDKDNHSNVRAAESKNNIFDKLSLYILGIAMIIAAIRLLYNIFYNLYNFTLPYFRSR